MWRIGHHTMMFAKIMKARIEPRDRFWEERKYQLIESGKGWAIERPCKTVPKEVPNLEDLLDNFFKKRKKWE